MDNVQSCDSYINVPSLQTYRCCLDHALCDSSSSQVANSTDIILHFNKKQYCSQAVESECSA
jgi:hypothetical protein